MMHLMHVFFIFSLLASAENVQYPNACMRQLRKKKTIFDKNQHTRELELKNFNTQG